ncbi:MAG: DUF4886 domain-containing protein [Oscillospiraceae bacterium]
MIKILAIGNSFSEDATTYLHDMALSGGIDTKIVNLYIGGCSLKFHFENIEKDIKGYQYQLNGVATNRVVSIKEALIEEDWDYVTLQQASHDSGILETYIPYFSLVSEYVKKYVPNATQLIHQTWAYGVGSDHSAFPLYNCSQLKMYDALTDAYHYISKMSGLGMIPSGKLIQTLRETNRFDLPNSEITLLRDGFHLSYIYGRYAIAALWYTLLLEDNIIENEFIPKCNNCDNNINQNIINLIKQIIMPEILKK